MLSAIRLGFLESEFYRYVKLLLRIVYFIRFVRILVMEGVFDRCSRMDNCVDIDCGLHPLKQYLSIGLVAIMCVPPSL